MNQGHSAAATDIDFAFAVAFVAECANFSCAKASSILYASDFQPRTPAMTASPPDDPLQSRLDHLGKALDAERGASQKAGEDRHTQSTGSAMNLGFRVLTEFVAAVVVGALLGWQLDVWLGTAPICLIVLLALGTAAGFWNVYRIAAAPPGKPRR